LEEVEKQTGEAAAEHESMVMKRLVNGGSDGRGRKNRRVGENRRSLKRVWRHSWKEE
jgi:hypothetical protein